MAGTTLLRAEAGSGNGQEVGVAEEGQENSRGRPEGHGRFFFYSEVDGRSKDHGAVGKDMNRMGEFHISFLFLFKDFLKSVCMCRGV